MSQLKARLGQVKYLGTDQHNVECQVGVLMTNACPAQTDVQSIRITGEVYAFDRDTIELKRVLLRLHGIDAPENGQKCSPLDRCIWLCGSADSSRMLHFISGKVLDCTPRDRGHCNKLNGNAALVVRGVSSFKSGIARLW